MLRPFLALLFGACTAGAPSTQPSTPAAPTAEPGTAAVPDAGTESAATATPAVVCAQQPLPTTSDELATRMSACLKTGKVEQSRALMEASASLVGESPAASLQAARTLMAQRKDHGVCEHEAYLSTIMEHLDHAVVDGKIKAGLASDSSFVELRSTMHFAALSGADTSTAKGLTGLVFHSPGNGAYGSVHQLHLHADGVAAFRDLDIEPEQPVWRKTVGTWGVADGKVWTVRAEGTKVVLDIVGYTLDVPSTPMPEWVDQPSECEA